MPEFSHVREVSIPIRRVGFRDLRIIIVTTLVDAKRYSAKQLGQLYGLRGQATEVNLRHLKTTLGMEMLSAKTLQMVRKDLWAHLLAYHLLRTVILQTSRSSQQDLSRLLLQGTRQQFVHTIGLLAIATQKRQQNLYRALIEVVAKDLLPLQVFNLNPEW